MGSDVLEVSVPAEPRFLKCIRAFVTPVFESNFGADDTARLVLAVDEACANIIKHGQSWFLPTGRIALALTLSKRRIEIAVSNFCKEKDVEKIKPRDLEDLRPGGLGTHFINEVMDSVEFRPDAQRAGRMTLVLTKAIRGKETDEADD